MSPDYYAAYVIDPDGNNIEARTTAAAHRTDAERTDSVPSYWADIRQRSAAPRRRREVHPITSSPNRRHGRRPTDPSKRELNCDPLHDECDDAGLVRRI